MINEQTEEAVKSAGFATIERSLLEVVERDHPCSFLRWNYSRQSCNGRQLKESEKQGLVADGQVKRRILGQKIVKGIRFPVMTLEEFASVVLDSKVLTVDEVSDIVKCLSSVKGSQVGFPVSKSGASSCLERCFRFGSVVPGWSNPAGGGSESLIFSLNKNILLPGVYLFGIEGNDFSVRFCIFQPYPNYSTVVSTDGTYSSLHHKSKNYWGFDVLSYPHVSIIKGSSYCVEAVISGPDSFGGRNGNSHVESSGVTFTFQNTVSYGSATGVKQGQFPEFIFSLQE